MSLPSPFVYPPFWFLVFDFCFVFDYDSCLLLGTSYYLIFGFGLELVFDYSSFAFHFATTNLCLPGYRSLPEINNVLCICPGLHLAPLSDLTKLTVLFPHFVLEYRATKQQKLCHCLNTYRRHCISMQISRCGVWIKWPLESERTWDVFGPSNVDHQLAVSQVTERGEGFDVAVGYSGIRHGIDLLWFSHKQVGHNLVICKAAKGDCIWTPRRKQRDIIKSYNRGKQFNEPWHF